MLLALLLCAAQTSTDAPLALSGTWKAGTKSAPVFLRSKWRRAVGEALSKRPPPNTLTDVFEFGVYTGTSLQRIFEELQEHNISARRVWGFDSFVGLASDSGSEDGGRSSWFKGAFSAAEALRAHNYNEVKQRITAHILESKTLGSSEASRRVRKSLRFVRGFFNESLTPKLPQNRGIGPAMYVDVDVDQYFAAKQALSWVFEHGLAREGTLIGYDDFGSTPLWSAGESRAHLEIANEYQVTFELVTVDVRKCERLAAPAPPAKTAAPCTRLPENTCGRNFHPIFRVLSIGKPGHAATC